MKDLAVSQLVKEYLGSLFPDIYIGAPVDGDNITLPAILLDVQSEFLLGSRVSKGQLTVMVNTLAVPDNKQNHIDLCESVDDAVRLLKGVSNSTVEIVGVVPKTVREAPVNQNWSTNVDYILAFEQK